MGGRRKFEELRLPMPWGHVAAKAWGSPKDKRVLVVHGLLDNAGAFDRLIPLLPDGFYYVCIDLPGHGLSSHFPAGIPLDFSNYVLVIRRVLNELQWTKCIYVAHSFGAQIGICFGIVYPEMVEKILSLDSLVPLPVSNDEIVGRIRAVHDDSLKVYVPNLYSLEEVLHALTNLRFSALNTEAAKAVAERAVTKVGNRYKYNRDPRLRMGVRLLLNIDQLSDLIKRLKVPLFVILAKANITGSPGRVLNEVINRIPTDRGHSFVVVEGNHDVHNNYPERVAPHIRQFLASIKSSI